MVVIESVNIGFDEYKIHEFGKNISDVVSGQRNSNIGTKEKILTSSQKKSSLLPTLVWSFLTSKETRPPCLNPYSFHAKHRHFYY